MGSPVQTVTLLTPLTSSVANDEGELPEREVPPRLSLLRRHRAQIAIEPVEDLANQIRPRHEVSMAAVVQDVMLVGRLGTECLEERLLIGFERKHEIVAAVHHQDGRPDPWSEIPGILLRRAAAALRPTTAPRP